MNRAPMIITFAALLAPIAAFAAERTPTDIVTDIYRIAAGPKGDYMAAGIDDPRVRKQFSHSLLKAMDAMNLRAKKTGELLLDFDPITSSQDPSVFDLKIEPEPGDSAHPVVDASFNRAASENDLKRHIVRYIFLREGNAWKLDDIGGTVADDKWSLRETLQQLMK